MTRCVLQSYETIAEARGLQKLVPAFDNLYNAIAEQKKAGGPGFRANAGAAPAQSRHGANAQQNEAARASRLPTSLTTSAGQPPYDLALR